MGSGVGLGLGWAHRGVEEDDEDAPETVAVGEGRQPQVDGDDDLHDGQPRHQPRSRVGVAGLVTFDIVHDMGDHAQARGRDDLVRVRIRVEIKDRGRGRGRTCRP